MTKLQDVHWCRVNIYCSDWAWRFIHSIERGYLLFGINPSSPPRAIPHPQPPLDIDILCTDIHIHTYMYIPIPFMGPGRPRARAGPRPGAAGGRGLDICRMFSHVVSMSRCAPLIGSLITSSTNSSSSNLPDVIPSVSAASSALSAFFQIRVP